MYTMNDCGTCNKNQVTCNPGEDFCQGHELMEEKVNIAEDKKHEEFEFNGTLFKVTKHVIDRVKERFPKNSNPLRLIKQTVKNGLYHYSSTRQSYCVADTGTDCALIITTEFVIVTAIKISNTDEGCKKNKFIKVALDRRKKFREYLI